MFACVFQTCVIFQALSPLTDACEGVQVGKGRTLFRLDTQTLDRVKIADIPTPNTLAISWVHDLPFTENYIIIMDTPLKYDLAVRLQSVVDATHHPRLLVGLTFK